MSRTIKLKYPKTKDDLRVNHIKALTNPDFQHYQLTTTGKVKFMSQFLGKSEGFIRRIDMQDLDQAIIHCFGLYHNMQLKKKPKKEVTIAGKVYELVNMERPPVGYIMDTDASDFIEDPVRLACLSYIPKGTTYGEMDEHDNLLYPVKDRYKDFEEHFNLEDFVNLNAFFLLKLKKSLRLYILRARIKISLRRLRLRRK